MAIGTRPSAVRIGILIRQHPSQGIYKGIATA
jgi:hypothetical protein